MECKWRGGGRIVLPIGAIAVVCGLLSVSCSKSDGQEANQKRWNNFQKDNKRDVGVGMSAYEKRQAQLAEKKKKEAEKKPGENKPTP